MSHSQAIGIDLGTTFSLAAVCRHGRPEVIPNKEGQRLTPSVVFYHPNNLEVAVGTTAEDMEPEFQKNVLFDLKRLIGRKYHDAYVQEKMINNPDYKFKIVEGEEGNAEIELTHDDIKVCKSPEQACSEILKYLRECACEYLGVDVTEAVISIPAHFSNAQRKATRSAAELAGLKVLKLITEPVAGAIHFALDRLETQTNLLVFDFGGGTLDVSIIDVNEKTFQVRSVEGDTFLGGRDFDEKIMNYFRDRMVEEYGEQSVKKWLRRLRRYSIKMKQKLSTAASYQITIDFPDKKKIIEHKLEMSRIQFEEQTMQLLTDSIKVVDKCLKEAGLFKQDITDVVLVGGTTRIPKLREMLRTYFAIEELRTDLNPDEAVALGAAIQAASLKNNSVELEKYKITEVTPLSLGSGLEGGLMQFIIKKNSPLPFRSKPITTSTAVNNQSGFIIDVYEGERKNCAYNNLLGSFRVDNIPKRKAGEIEIETTYSLNEDGILQVDAFETTTGKRNKLVVNIGEYRLCENKIKNITDDAENNLREDDIFEIFILYKYKVRRRCDHILYGLTLITSDIERNFVQKQCVAFKDFMKTLEYNEIDSLRMKYKYFRSVVKPIVQNYSIDVDLKQENKIMDSTLRFIKDTNQQFQPNVGSSSVTNNSTRKTRRNNRRRRKKKITKSVTYIIQE